MSAEQVDLPDALTDETLRQTLQSLGSAVAVVRSDGSVVFENGAFFSWFPPGEEVDESVGARVQGLRMDRLGSRVADGRQFTAEVEAQARGRAVPVGITATALPEPNDDLILIEGRDLSKQKQAEYMLESYSSLSEKNARELQREKERVERLLLNVMPKSVYEEMRNYGTVTPQVFDGASILMLDFVGHTEKAIARDPGSLVTELNDIFNVFDRITEMFGCERIRTVGDAYMAVSGLPEPNTEHASNIARVALRMLRYITKRNSAHPEAWECRIGINSGPVVGSLVGVQKYVYDIFGPGVNLAARMESVAEPMQVTISEATYELVKDDFVCTELGDHELKGFGTQRVFSLDRELASR